MALRKDDLQKIEKIKNRGIIKFEETMRVQEVVTKIFDKTWNPCRALFNINKKYDLWFPQENHPGWINKVFDNYRQIEEDRLSLGDEFKRGRIVFCKRKNENFYTFIGIFELNNNNGNANSRFWSRNESDVDVSKILSI
jgi:hypothetical protein